MTSLLTAYRRAHAELCDLPRGSLKEFKAALNKVAKGLGGKCWTRTRFGKPRPGHQKSA